MNARDVSGLTAEGPCEPVVCLHASASSSSQWRSLADQAGTRWRWHLPELYGHGGRPGWPELMPSELTVEAKGVLCDLALPPDEGFHLVAHSYGAAVALQMAILQPRRVRSLTLYEPAAFGLLLADGPTDLAWEEIADVAARLTLELRAGDDLQAARGFCAYWHGRDIWHQLYLSQKVRLARAMPTVERHFQALFSANWDEAQLSRVRAPVLLICGEHTRNSARRVALNLAARLPLVQLKVLADADHMTPLTDAARVNAVVLDALQRQPQPSRTSPADLDFRKTLR